MKLQALFLTILSFCSMALGMETDENDNNNTQEDSELQMALELSRQTPSNNNHNNNNATTTSSTQTIILPPQEILGEVFFYILGSCKTRDELIKNIRALIFTNKLFNAVTKNPMFHQKAFAFLKPILTADFGTYVEKFYRELKPYKIDRITPVSMLRPLIYPLLPEQVLCKNDDAAWLYYDLKKQSDTNEMLANGYIWSRYGYIFQFDAVKMARLLLQQGATIVGLKKSPFIMAEEHNAFGVTQALLHHATDKNITNAVRMELVKAISKAIKGATSDDWYGNRPF